MTTLIKIIALIMGFILAIFSFLAMCVVEGKRLNIDIYTQAIPILDFIGIILSSILILFIPLIFYLMGKNNL